MSNTYIPVGAAGLPFRRRALIALIAAGAALALPTAGNAAAPSANPDVRLLALGAELDAIQARLAQLLPTFDAGDPTGPVDGEYEALDEESSQYLCRIAAEPALTLQGFAVKARALAYIYAEGLTAEGYLGNELTTDHKLTWSILSGLLAIGGAA